MKQQCPQCGQFVRVRLAEHGREPGEMMIPCEGSGKLIATDGSLFDLLSDLADSDPCYFDHHGYCQAHNWFTTEPKCPHARAKEVLDNKKGG